MTSAVTVTLVLTLTLGGLQARSSEPPTHNPFSLESMIAEVFGLQLQRSERQDLVDQGLAGNYPLAYMPTDELIKHWGFQAETHYVTTDDGYVLCVHRIANPKSKYPPVFFQHGLMAASDLWLMRGPEEELAFQLALQGYDVWLGNVRGNTYSRNHTVLSPDDERFWNFSWHEMGTHDLPAVIDYVLAKTRKPKLFYIGHSMGTTQFYVMASARPEYNDKIIVQFSLAPICFMGNMRAYDLFQPLAQNFDFYKLNPLMARNNVEFFPRSPAVSELLYGMVKNPLTTATFWDVLWSAVGPDPELVDTGTVALFLGHAPNGVSEQTLRAYTQTLLWKDKFNRFDHEPAENLRRYGSIHPPAYNLSAITAKVALYYAENDYLSHPKDVRKLAAKLPNVVKKKLITYKKFNHMDYIWGTNSKKHFAGEIMDLIKKYS